MHHLTPLQVSLSATVKMLQVMTAIVLALLFMEWMMNGGGPDEPDGFA